MEAKTVAVNPRSFEPSYLRQSFTGLQLQSTETSALWSEEENPRLDSRMVVDRVESGLQAEPFRGNIK